MEALPCLRWNLIVVEGVMMIKGGMWMNVELLAEEDQALISR